MRKSSLTLAIRIVGSLSILIACLTPLSSCPAQTTDRSVKSPQDFGAGLKQYRREANVSATGAETSRQAQGDAGHSDDVIRTNTLLTQLDVTVTDASGARFITGLTKDNFLVVEDGDLQQIDTVTLGDDTKKMPRSIVLILDWSGSLLPYLGESIKAAKSLVDQLAPSDEMAIVTDDVKLVAGFTADKRLLKSALDSIREATKRGWRGKSRQFSALLATLKDLIDVERKRPIIIFQTDGDEAHNLQDPQQAASTLPGTYYMSDIYAEVQRSRVKIYTLIPGERLMGISENELLERGRRLLQGYETSYQKYSKPYGRNGEKLQVPDQVIWLMAESHARGQEAAARVAELAGGWTTFFESPQLAAEVYGQILSDMNHQYIISYYPTNKERDARLRKVRVEVQEHPEFTVRSRQSYYALPQ